VTDAIVNSIDDTSTAVANDIGTSLSAPDTRTVNHDDAGTHHYVMTASKSGYTSATCSTDLKVNPNTDTIGGPSAP
jgi:hypothetical protein